MYIDQYRLLWTIITHLLGLKWHLSIILNLIEISFSRDLTLSRDVTLAWKHLDCLKLGWIPLGLAIVTLKGHIKFVRGRARTDRNVQCMSLSRANVAKVVPLILRYCEQFCHFYIPFSLEWNKPLNSGYSQVSPFPFSGLVVLAETQ
jgi:hypothetical protein